MVTCTDSRDKLGDCGLHSATLKPHPSQLSEAEQREAEPQQTPSASPSSPTCSSVITGEQRLEINTFCQSWEKTGRVFLKLLCAQQLSSAVAVHCCSCQLLQLKAVGGAYSQAEGNGGRIKVKFLFLHE